MARTTIRSYRTYVIGFAIDRGALPDALYWDGSIITTRLQPGDNGMDFVLVGGEDIRAVKPMTAPTSFHRASAPYRRTASTRAISTIRKHRRHSTRSRSLRIAPSVRAGDGLVVSARGSASTLAHQHSSSVCVVAGAAASRMRLAVSSAFACFGVGNLLQNRYSSWKKITEKWGCCKFVITDRERYIPDPTHSESLFSKTYRAA